MEFFIISKNKHNEFENSKYFLVLIDLHRGHQSTRTKNPEKSGLTRRIISRLKARWIKRGVLCCAGVSITLLELVLEPAPSPRIVFTSVGALKKCTRIDDKLRRIDDTSPFSALLGGDLWLRELIEKTCQSVKGRYTTYSHIYSFSYTHSMYYCILILILFLTFILAGKNLKPRIDFHSWFV